MKTVVFVPKQRFTKEELKLIGNADFHGEKVRDEADLITKCRDADYVLASVLRTRNLTKKFFDSLPKLKFVSLFATGYEWVDIDAAKKHGVVVSNAPNYSTEAVAEYSITMILRLARENKKEVLGKTLGVIGYGAIGKRVTEMAKGLGMNVLVWNRTKKTEITPLEILLKESDFVSIHLAHTKETEKFLGKKELGLMKPSAILINSAREELVDNEELARLLKDEKLAGAAIELNHHSKTKMPGAILTPHIAWDTTESLKKGQKIFFENLIKFKEGKQQNVIT